MDNMIVLYENNYSFYSQIARIVLHESHIKFKSLKIIFEEFDHL